MIGTGKKYEQYTVAQDGRMMLGKSEKEQLETVWDRFEAQLPQCGYCEMGLSCRNCAMGPCRVDPFGEGPQQGVCGADADIIVARNLCRMIASGAASHSDHGRDLVEVLLKVAEGKAPGYQIKDPEKLMRVAGEYGVDTSHKVPEAVAGELAYAMQEDYGTRKQGLQLLSRVPPKRKEVWEKLGITPRGIDRETSEMMHRTHMGVDNDWQSLLLQGMRNALSDGWGGSLIATEVSDILFGTPKPVTSTMNMGVLKEDQVNIVVHGHNPVVSEMVCQAVQDTDLLNLAKGRGANGINLVGLCCTGNELLMRHGIPMAGNHLMTEQVLVTGAVEMMLVDYQCIMPSLGHLGKCFHTRMISTSDKAKFPGMEHREFHPENARDLARVLVREAVENFSRRAAERVYLPVESVPMMAGFSVEAILSALGGTADPLIEALKAGKIRGAAGSLKTTSWSWTRGVLRWQMPRPGLRRPKQPSWRDPASRRCAAPWASRPFFMWEAAWTMCASWFWPPPSPTPWEPTSAIFPLPALLPSGIRKRPSPSPFTLSLQASTRFWAPCRQSREA
jgi:carbon-monoxide dehydrogenase catalytic subunit